MQEIKLSKAVNLNQKLSTGIMNTFVIYTITMFLKLFYFNSQIGDSEFWGGHGLAAIGPLVILVSFGFLFNKAAKWYMTGLNVALTILIYSNVLFYRYFNDLVSIPLLFQAGNLSDIQSSMLELLHFVDLLLVLDFIMIPIIKKTVGWSEHGDQSKSRKLWGAFICFSTGVFIVLLSFNHLLKSQPTILKTFYDRVYVAQNIGLINYHAADAYTFVRQSVGESSTLDAQRQKKILEFFKAKKQMGSKDNLLFGAAQGKNIIVIQVEALQQFTINKSINGQEITPNLNKLAASGLYFDNYYYQTAGGGTSDAEFTANVSMFPMKEGAVYIRKPGNYYYSMPIKLKENNYSTIAMHGYKPGFWNRSVVYKNIGFDEFYSKNNMKENELLGMGISDKDFFGQAVEKLKTQKKPYFAFLITLTSHFPYDNDKSKYSSLDVLEYKDTLLGNYLEAIHYTDEALGQFINELRDNGMLEDTVLVVYGDHHGIPKDNEKELAEFLGKDGFSSLEWLQLQKVPMIISAPGIAPKTISTAGGGMDFMPTLLNIMGINTDNQPNFGRDLINFQEGLAVLRNGSFVTNEKAYISSENICYDVRTGKTLSIELYSDIKQKAEMLLDYSDTIIKFDLSDEIRDYLENERP